MAETCIENHNPDTGGRTEFIAGVTEYQRATIDMADAMLNSNNGFFEAFFRNVGIPLPVIGGFIHADIIDNIAHSAAIEAGAELDIPGYEKVTVQINGRDITFFTDATNVEGEAITRTIPKLSSHFIEKHQVEYDHIKSELEGRAISERDEAISEKGLDGYNADLRRFLNVELPNHIAGITVVDPNCELASLEQDKPTIQIASAEMTDFAGSHELLELMAEHPESLLSQDLIKQATINEPKHDSITPTPTHDQLAIA